MPKVIDIVKLDNKKEEHIKLLQKVNIEKKEQKNNNNDPYKYYTKNDADLYWNVDDKYNLNTFTNQLCFVNKPVFISNKNNMSTDIKHNFLKSNFNFKHLEKLKETKTINTSRLIHILYSSLIDNNIELIS